MEMARNGGLSMLVKVGLATVLSLAGALMGVPIVHQAEAADAYVATGGGSTKVEDTGTYTVTSSSSSGSGTTGFIEIRIVPTFYFESSYVSKTYGDSSFKNALTNTSDGTVTYTSSNTSVATVSSSGKVTIVGAGSTTITASVAKTSTHSAASASYTLKVAKATPTLSFASSTVNVALGDTGAWNSLTWTGDGDITWSSSNTSVASISSSGALTINGAGTTTISVYAAETANYKSASASCKLVVGKKSAALYFSSYSVSKTYGDGSFTNALTKTTDGSVTYSSSNTSVATVDSSGKVTIVGAGSATITASAAATDTYEAVSASYRLAVGKATAKLEYATSSVSKTCSDSSFTNALTKTTDGSISYSSSNTSVAKVDSSGRVTIVGVGSATIKATAAATSNYSSASASYKLTVVKAAAKLSFASSEVYKKADAAKFENKLSSKTDGKITYKSSNTRVATVSSSGTVTVKGLGKTTITASSSSTKYYSAGSASYTLNVTKRDLTKTKISGKSSFSKKYSSDKQTVILGAKASSGVKLKYKSSSKKVKVSKSGKVTIPSGFLGEVTVTIKAKQTSDYTAASKKIKIKVHLAYPKLKSLKSTREGWIVAEWGSVAGAVEYRVTFSRSVDDSDATPISVGLDTSASFGGFESGMKYYVRVYAYGKNGSCVSRRFSEPVTVK